MGGKSGFVLVLKCFGCGVHPPAIRVFCRCGVGRMDERGWWSPANSSSLESDAPLFVRLSQPTREILQTLPMNLLLFSSSRSRSASRIRSFSYSPSTNSYPPSTPLPTSTRPPSPDPHTTHVALEVLSMPATSPSLPHHDPCLHQPLPRAIITVPAKSSAQLHEPQFFRFTSFVGVSGCGDSGHKRGNSQASASDSKNTGFQH